MLLGIRHTQVHAYTYGALTLYGAPFQGTSTSRVLSYCASSRQTRHATFPQPHTYNPCRVSRMRGLASSDFARHYSRNHFCFLFLWVLRCFTSPRSLHTPYFIQMRVTGHDSSWVSPFGHPRITARLPTPQGLSQAPTSFIGSRCQGIHHVPFTACHHQHHTTPGHNHDQTQRTTTPPHTHQQNPTRKTRSTSTHRINRAVVEDDEHTTKMLASTIQISNNNPTPPTHQNLADRAAGTPKQHHPQPPPPTSRTRPAQRTGRLRRTRETGTAAPDASEPQQCAPTPPTTDHPAQDRTQT